MVNPTDAIQDRPSPGVPSIQIDAIGTRPDVRWEGSAARKLLLSLASLKITVTLFLFSLVLIFFGTWAQIDTSVWTVVNQYFRSIIVWIPVKVLLLYSVPVETLQETGWDEFSVPFPGGWLLGSIMMVNLLAAHAVSFKLSWRRSGIILIHAGIVLMMIGEFITGVYAIEGHMTIVVDGSSNYVDHSLYPEIAVTTYAETKKVEIKPRGKKANDAPTFRDVSFDKVVTVPRQYLAAGTLIQNEQLPFDIKIEKYFRNSSVIEILDPSFQNPATKGVGTDSMAIERPEVSGTDQDQKVDAPSAYVTLIDRKSGDALGTYLISINIYEPQKVKVGGEDYNLSLRFKRSYRPYSIHLDRFDFDKYVGTETPKDFRSHVRLDDPANPPMREVQIYMNHPLRYQGETFFQASYLRDGRGTVLQVVRNPGWLLPYISCIVVGVGMLIHFGLNLSRFINKQVKA